MPYKSQGRDQLSRSRAISCSDRVSLRRVVSWLAAVEVTAPSVSLLVRLELYVVYSVPETIHRLRLCRPPFQAKAGHTHSKLNSGDLVDALRS